jgi:hypothetical protein
MQSIQIKADSGLPDEEVEQTWYAVPGSNAAEDEKFANLAQVRNRLMVVSAVQKKPKMPKIKYPMKNHQ